MKYCIHCGAQLPAEAQFCSACGKLQTETSGFRYASEPPKSQPQAKQQNADTLGKVGLAFMIVTIVILCITALWYTISCLQLAKAFDTYLTGYFYLYVIGLLLPLTWCIPMTVIVQKRLKTQKPISVGFKVCTLIFVNIVSGIVLLCRKENDNS